MVTRMIILFLLVQAAAAAQKKVLQLTDNVSWHMPNLKAVSSNGRYVLYNEGEWTDGVGTLVVQATDGSRKQLISRTTDGAFLGNGYIAFSGKKDTVGWLDIATQQVHYIGGVQSHSIPEGGNGHYIAYTLKSNPGELVVQQVPAGKQQILDSVIQFSFGNDGKVLMAVSRRGAAFRLHRVVPGVSARVIWEGTSIPEHWVFSPSGREMTFLTKQPGALAPDAVYHYDVKHASAQCYASEQTIAPKAFSVQTSMHSISQDGKMVFFGIVPRPSSPEAAKADAAQVDVWHYLDVQLQSYQQANMGQQDRGYLAAAGPDGHFIRIEQERERKLFNARAATADVVLIRKDGGGDNLEENWNEASLCSLVAVSLKDGTRRTITEKMLPGYLDNNAEVSPTGKYIVYYKRQDQQYYLYDTQKGATANISAMVPVPLSVADHDLPNPPTADGICAWGEKDAFLLVYDNFDIWKLDLPLGKHPVNITNGYGRRNNIVLRLMPPETAYQMSPASAELAADGSMLLSGHDKRNKDNGYFRTTVNAGKDPELLTMGPYLYHYLLRGYSGVHTLRPRKAQAADVFVVGRMNEQEAPNLFATKDFRHFTPLSSTHPNKEWNWMTTELVRWEMFDGKPGEGILYKPENFDPSKRYPVIFYFYERNADNLHHFLSPALSNGSLMIPYFVSQGYLVFDPNIYYTIGHPSRSAYNSIASAAKFLAGLPWVDSTKMGLQGISFGGYEVNCLITQTPIFAAAAESAGVVDFVSGYGALSRRGISNQFQYEKNQCRIGAMLWDKPELYIENSPIFQAHKITTPLLIMHNKKDEAVAFTQGVALFTAMRRLRKPCWMLQYDGDEHGIFNNVHQRDFSIRLMQFFDHYLKGAPAPVWMTKGIPASMKGVADGLEVGEGVF